MNTDAIIVTGLFQTEAQTLAAIEKIRENGWEVKEVNSPIPSEKLSQALKRKKSRVGLFVLVGGVIGFFSGFLLAAFTATRWDLIVSGKPILSWVPFFIVAFEFTILFAVLGNVVGLLTQIGLPVMDYETNYDPSCSGSMYGIQAAAAAEEAEQLKNLMQQNGSVSKLRDTP